MAISHLQEVLDEACFLVYYFLRSGDFRILFTKENFPKYVKILCFQSINLERDGFLSPTFI